MPSLYEMAQGPEFDPLGAFMAGKQAKFDAAMNQNKLAELARADAARPLFGKAVMGDQNALAGLAQYDPASALDVKKVAISQQNADRETQQKEYDRIAGVLTAADTPEKWGQAIQFLEAQGATISPEERDFNNRAFVIAQGGDEAKKLGLKPRTQIVGVGGRQKLVNLNDGSEIADLGPANNVAGAGGQDKPPAGYRWTPEGALEPIPGGPRDPNAPAPMRTVRPNNDQNNAAGFYDRMIEAEKVLGSDTTVSAATDFTGKLKANLPFGAGNYFATPEYQAYDQARRDFINAQLRKESGAAISQGEFDSADKQYFPQPGDSEAVIQQKARNRATAINAMKRTAGPALTQGQGQPSAVPAAPQGEDNGAPQGWNEQDLPQIIQDAQDAIQQGADPEAVIQDMIDNGVNPDYARTLLNGQ